MYLSLFELLEAINKPRDTIFPNEGYAPPRIHNCPFPRSVVFIRGPVNVARVTPVRYSRLLLEEPD
jgi:hypothetical protein